MNIGCSYKKHNISSLITKHIKINFKYLSRRYEHLLHNPWVSNFNTCLCVQCTYLDSSWGISLAYAYGGVGEAGKQCLGVHTPWSGLGHWTLQLCSSRRLTLKFYTVSWGFPEGLKHRGLQLSSV